MSEASRPLPPDEVAPAIWRVQIPLATGLEPVNAYLLLDDDGTVTVFDTGIAPGAEPLWRAALAHVERSPADVQRIVVSHHHPDHIGGSGALHRLTSAPLLATTSTIRQAPDVWGDRGRMEAYFTAIAAHLTEHGFPPFPDGHVARESSTARSIIELPPDGAWDPVDDGDRIEAAGRTWDIIATPGHADGHLVLHDRAGGLLLGADHILERISPAVGRFPRHERNPLARYLESLMKIAMLDPGTVLPGHGDPFDGAAARARVLAAHHQERLDQGVAIVTEIGEATAYEVAVRMFPRVFASGAHDPANARFATTEALAHLEHARSIGRLARARDATTDQIRFAAAGD